jgi:hypothetical protein
MRLRPIAFSEVLHLVEVLAIVGATVFAGYQLREVRLQNSADLALRLGQELDTGINQKIIDALDSDPTTPILKRAHRGGTVNDTQLEWYLAEYEKLDDLYRNGLITCRMMYNEFSYDLERHTRTRTL